MYVTKSGIEVERDMTSRFHPLLPPAARGDIFKQNYFLNFNLNLQKKRKVTLLRKYYNITIILMIIIKNKIINEKWIHGGHLLWLPWIPYICKGLIDVTY